MSELNTQQKSKDDELGSFYMGRMRPPPEPRRMLPRGLLTVLAVIAFAGVIWYAYPQGQEKYSDLDIPTISADKSVYKFKPEDPGGMEVPHQDSTVFDPIEKKAAGESAEHLRPDTEEPVNKDEAIKDTAVKDAPTETPPPGMNAQISDNADGTEKVVPKAEARPKTFTTKTEIVKTDTVKTDTVKTDTKPATPPAEKAPAAAAKTEAPKAATAASKSGVYIQLGAYKDAAAAKADWAKLQKKYPGQLGSLETHTETVRRPSGTLERLQAGRVPAEKAKQICAAVIAGGNACIVVY